MYKLNFNHAFFSVFWMRLGKFIELRNITNKTPLSFAKKLHYWYVIRTSQRGERVQFAQGPRLMGAQKNTFFMVKIYTIYNERKWKGRKRVPKPDYAPGPQIFAWIHALASSPVILLVLKSNQFSPFGFITFI